MRFRPHPRHADVLVDPRVRFGAPQVQGVPTEALWSLHQAGEDVAAIAADFGLPRARVEEAIALEAELQAAA